MGSAPGESPQLAASKEPPPRNWSLLRPCRSYVQLVQAERAWPWGSEEGARSRSSSPAPSLGSPWLGPQNSHAQDWAPPYQLGGGQRALRGSGSQEAMSR